MIRTVSFLFCFLVIPLYANVYEYAKIQNNEISPDIICNGNDHEAVCSVKNIEWIDGVIVQDFQYKAFLHNNIFTQIKSYELQTNNLNFEGYNIASLMPTFLVCKNVSKYKLFHKKHAITTNISCKLKSDVYDINVTADFNTVHPLYQQNTDTLILLELERQRFAQPINTNQDETWKKDYIIHLDSLNLSIKSYSLNNVIFNLYKREQRIADDSDSENDKDYRILNDTKVKDDYYLFLQNIYEIYNNIIASSPSLSATNTKSLKHLFDTFIAIATLPNKNAEITLRGKKDSAISLQELEDITDINESILKVIAKILQNTQLSIQQ